MTSNGNNQATWTILEVGFVLAPFGKCDAVVFVVTVHDGQRTDD